MRALTCNFLNELKRGVLAPLTDAVKSDTSLCLELRNSYLNIYYRGGNLSKVSLNKRDCGYNVRFDEKYFKGGTIVKYPKKIQNCEDIERLLVVFPYLKYAMDRYFSKYRKEEREFQQVILRDNNFSSIANGTDYYICDIEYQHKKSNRKKFDMVGVHWPSKSRTGAAARNRKLVFIEVKFGDQALDGPSGLQSHIKDVNEFVSNTHRLNEFKKDMARVFNQKRELGFLCCANYLESFSDEPPCLVLMLANHNPNSTKLRDILCNLPPSPHVNLCIATASFLGYGLYDQGIHPLNKAWTRFGDYICKDLPPPR